MLLQIGLTEALTGFQKPISFLDGRTLLVNTVKGEVVDIKSFYHALNKRISLFPKVIRPDELKIVRGEGMPKYEEPSGKGNLIIRSSLDFNEY